MPQFFVRCLAPIIIVLATAGYSLNVFATDALEGRALIEAQLEEAKRLLAEDTASHDDTAQKKLEIDQKLVAQQQREAEIKEEMKMLCEEQDKLKPGSMASCVAKLNN